MMKWIIHPFDKWWYKYLFEPRHFDDYGWLKNWLVVIWCRLRNHPAGIVYYNPNGFEPDTHCKNCGDDLG